MKTLLLLALLLEPQNNQATNQAPGDDSAAVAPNQPAAGAAVAEQGLAAQLTLLDGQSSAGQLTAITPAALTLQGAMAEQQVPLDSVLTLELKSAGAAAPAAATQELLLHDGGRLAGEQIVRTAQQLTIVSRGLGSVQLPSAAVRAVRLQPENPAWTTQWKAFLQRESDKDLLIVPRRGGDGLDFLAGIVTAISAEEIAFLLDGDNIPVPAQRVYGVVFPRATTARSSSGITLQTQSQEQLVAASVTFDGAEFRIQAAWGQTLQLAADQLRSLDFSRGRIRYLADMEVLKEEFLGLDPAGSLFAGLIDETTARLMYGPRRNTSLDPRLPIRLRGRRYERGLCIHSRTRLTWALDRQFTSLEATIGIDDEVAFNQVSRVSLTVTGDDAVLLEKVLVTSDDPEPLKLSLDGVSTLTILVDYADGDSSCDWLDLADARLILATKDK